VKASDKEKTAGTIEYGNDSNADEIEGYYRILVNGYYTLILLWLNLEVNFKFYSNPASDFFINQMT